MLGRIIRQVDGIIYKHPTVPQDICGTGPFGQLKVGLVADYFTSVSVAVECRVRSLTPANYEEVISTWRPDLVFVESAFHGVGGEWRYELARQPRYIRMVRPRAIFKLVQLARDRGIPTIFWNKDDGAFFDAFIDIARLFKHVFTTDNRCVSLYRKELPADSTANVLAMPYQPAFHNFTGFNFEQHAACFVGSYYKRILDNRRNFLNSVFKACENVAMPLHVFDRNSNRLSHFFEFRFPQNSVLNMHEKIPYIETGSVYKRYSVSLNANSVTDSETMYSRRLLEILACGGICVTNNSPAVEKFFGEYCHTVESQEQARALLKRLRLGTSGEDKEKAAAGAAYVRRHHTWQCRLEQLADIVNF